MKSGALLFAFVMAFAVPCQAVEIDIRAGGLKAVGTLLLVEAPDIPTTMQIEQEMTWRIAFNGVFALRKKSELPRSVFAGAKPDWKFLQSTGVDVALVVQVVWEVDDEGRRLTLRAYGPDSDKPVVDRILRLREGNDRTLYDTAASRLYEAFLGTSGPFGEMIYFQRKISGQRHRELYRFRLGETQPTAATRGMRIAMRPRSAADGSRILMIGYANGMPEIWEMATSSGQLRLAFADSTPAFGAVPGPDGTIYYSHADGRFAELRAWNRGESYTLIGGRSMNLGIDVAADGNSAVFSSDRFGNPHLFRLDSLKPGAVPVRITFAGEYNAAPRISPDGRWIAFARRESGSFSIFAISPDGKQIRRLTDDKGSDEDPAWSRDNRTLYFSSDRGRKTGTDLYAVDLWTGIINKLSSWPGEDRMPEALREP